MENLYYSPIEKILFWIVGYTSGYDSVKKLIEMFESHVAELQTVIPKSSHKNAIRTGVVSESRSYKNMRYYWVKLPRAPKEAFVIGSKRTMIRWLTD